MEGIKVDGNDIFAVYAAMTEAVQRARAGKGPTLIECFTYRLADHTSSDDAAKYRKQGEVALWAKKDPIPRLKKYLTTTKLWDEAKEKQLRATIQQEINEAVEAYEKSPPPKVDDMFLYMYKKIPGALQEQLDSIR